MVTLQTPRLTLTARHELLMCAVAIGQASVPLARYQSCKAWSARVNGRSSHRITKLIPPNVRSNMPRSYTSRQQRRGNSRTAPLAPSLFFLLHILLYLPHYLLILFFGPLQL